MTPTISRIDTRRVVVPLTRPWGPTVTSITVVTVDVYDSAGDVGHGFSWTPTIGGTAVHAMLDNDIVPWAVGREAEPTWWRAAWEHLHEAGGGGVTTIALAGLDLALWDLRCRRQSTGIDELLGRRHDSQPAYGSGINLHYSCDELVDQAERLTAAGCRAVKVKVGKPDLAEDAERVAAVRAAIGPTTGLMIDANQRWDLPATLRALDALAGFDLEWLEEPIRADDLWAYRRLRKHSPVPIALGENLHTIYRFRDFIEAEAVDIIQPNIIRVGGITPFRRIVELARSHSIKVMPHLLPELSGQLALTLAEPTLVEDVEDASFERLGVLAGASPVRVSNSRLTLTGHTGLGFSFAEKPALVSK